MNACRAQTPFRFAYISCRMPSNLLCEAWKAALASPGSCVWSMHREVLKVSSRYWTEGSVLLYFESRHTKLHSKQRAFAPIWHQSKLEGNTDLESRV
jgi:hypothetical protein